MVLNYNFNIKDGVLKYVCLDYSSCIKIKAKDVEKIYDIFNRLDDIEKRAAKDGLKRYVCNGFVIIFDFEECVSIENFSNWLLIKEEVPVIKKELSKYIKHYNTKSVKDIIVKIKSLKKGSSNRIKEELK